MIVSARAARAVFPPEQVAAVKALACELPATQGLPLGRFSRSELHRLVGNRNAYACVCTVLAGAAKRHAVSFVKRTLVCVSELGLGFGPMAQVVREVVQRRAGELADVRLVISPDEVVSSAGYRIGCGDAKECLEHRPAVSATIVVGVPDSGRGEIVKGYGESRDGEVATDGLGEKVDRGTLRLRARARWPKQRRRRTRFREQDVSEPA